MKIRVAPAPCTGPSLPLCQGHKCRPLGRRFSSPRAHRRETKQSIWYGTNLHVNALIESMSSYVYVQLVGKLSVINPLLNSDQ